MKKLLLGLGTITAVVAPIAAVVSCGEDSKPGRTDAQIKADNDRAVAASEAAEKKAAEEKAIKDENKIQVEDAINQIETEWAQFVSDQKSDINNYNRALGTFTTKALESEVTERADEAKALAAVANWPKVQEMLSELTPLHDSLVVAKDDPFLPSQDVYDKYNEITSKVQKIIDFVNDPKNVLTDTDKADAISKANDEKSFVEDKLRKAFVRWARTLTNNFGFTIFSDSDEQDTKANAIRDKAREAEDNPVQPSVIFAEIKEYWAYVVDHKIQSFTTKDGPHTVYPFFS